MAALAVLAYVVAEITAISVAASYLGVAWTFLLLLGSAALGGWLLRRETARTARTATDVFQLRRAPDRDLSDALFRVAAGLLIALPGFLSTLAGALCLFPPGRTALRALLSRTLAPGLRPGPTLTAPRGGHVPPPGTPPHPTTTARGRFTGDVVDGTVLDSTTAEDSPTRRD